MIIPQEYLDTDSPEWTVVRAVKYEDVSQAKDIVEWVNSSHALNFARFESSNNTITIKIDNGWIGAKIGDFIYLSKENIIWCMDEQSFMRNHVKMEQ
jgi:hypothetical protein